MNHHKEKKETHTQNHARMVEREERVKQIGTGYKVRHKESKQTKEHYYYYYYYLLCSKQDDYSAQVFTLLQN